VPGHGLKGKQKTLATNEDVEAMYDDYEGKQIRLWIKRHRPQKRTHSPSPIPSSKARRSGYDTHLEKMSEVEIIFEKLQETHDNFSPEQLRAWAHMLQMKKHDSYELPPDKPFFGKSRRKETMSPGKRINMRSKCIDQLEKWHRLMESGAISAEQYQELQHTILSDIKKF
jgi:hypothetical protein